MSKVFNGIKTVLLDKQRKSLFKITNELIQCTINEKEVPLHYFTCLLYKKEHENIENYISQNKMLAIIREVYQTDEKVNPLLEDKLKFSELLKSNNIYTPNILMNNVKNIFFVNEISISIQNKIDFISLIKNILEQNNLDSVFIKPIDGNGGTDTFRLSANNLNDDNVITTIYNTVINKKFLFQEVILQHKSINNIYHNSINTLRIHTYNDKDNLPRIASALMRFGVGGSIVDNGSSGGLYVPVDTDSWFLKGKGRSYFKNGGHMYNQHPDTNFLFDEFQLPFPQDIENIVLKSASLFPEEIVGWDVAITDKGPIIIEGNNNPHIVMAQAACGGFRNHPDFSYLFKEYL